MEYLRPPGLIGLVGTQQRNDQPYQFTGSQYNSPFVLVLTHLVILSFVVGSIVWVAHPDGIGCLTEVVTNGTSLRSNELQTSFLYKILIIIWIIQISLQT